MARAKIAWHVDARLPLNIKRRGECRGGEDKPCGRAAHRLAERHRERLFRRLTLQPNRSLKPYRNCASSCTVLRQEFSGLLSLGNEDKLNIIHSEARLSGHESGAPFQVASRRFCMRFKMNYSTKLRTVFYLIFKSSCVTRKELFLKSLRDVLDLVRIQESGKDNVITNTRPSLYRN